MTNQLEKHQYTGEVATFYHYDDLPIHAGKGIHEYVMQHILDNANKEATILVLGAGTGAFDKRLYDHGYSNITSVDINDNNYQLAAQKLTCLNFVAADLNHDFSQKLDTKFDIIVAIEIIEHLFSTPHFLSHCKTLLNKNGALLVSTPNPRSYASRWRFLLKGYHAGFEGIPKLYEHVNPIHIDIFRHHCHFANLKITQLHSFDHQWELPNIVKRALSSVLKFALSVIDQAGNKSLTKERYSILFLRIENQHHTQC